MNKAVLDLLKMGGLLAAIFASTFIAVKVAGVLTVDDLKRWFEAAHNLNVGAVALIVFALLVVDLFIAVPTMMTIMLAGYFLGFQSGVGVVVASLLTAGLLGYGLSRMYGTKLLSRIYKDEKRLGDITDVFSIYGPVVLMMCRALPILPEVSACLAGATRMRFRTFLWAYLLGTLPYAVVASYAGSISSVENPMPAVYAWAGLSLLFWGAWALLIRRHRKTG